MLTDLSVRNCDDAVVVCDTLCFYFWFVTVWQCCCHCVIIMGCVQCDRLQGFRIYTLKWLPEASKKYKKYKN